MLMQFKNRILIHDDVLAGGTTKAVCELVEQLGGESVQCNFLIELTTFLDRNEAAHEKHYP
jgi:adenine phosphoribosyltransferase